MPVDGSINSEKYVDILDTNLSPVVAKVFPASPWIFQDDNATPMCLGTLCNGNKGTRSQP